MTITDGIHPNPRELAARELKAATAADMLTYIEPPPHPDVVKHLDEDGWLALEAAAGINRCSDKTRERIAELYAYRCGVREQLRDAFAELDQADAVTAPVQPVRPARVVVAGSPADRAWYGDFGGAA